MKKHRFLPFITAPQWLPEFTGPKGTARVLSNTQVDTKATFRSKKDLKRHKSSIKVLYVLLISSQFQSAFMNSKEVSCFFLVILHIYRDSNGTSRLLALRTLEWIHGRKLQEIESEEERLKLHEAPLSEPLSSYCIVFLRVHLSSVSCFDRRRG